MVVGGRIGDLERHDDFGVEARRAARAEVVARGKGQAVGAGTQLGGGCVTVAPAPVVVG